MRSIPETAKPTSVRPRWAITGAAEATSCRAAARIGCVAEVANGSVRERVARPKSSNRSRSTTVRPVRPAARMRAVMRSIRLTTTASISAGDRAPPARPKARWAPTDRRRAPVVTRRQSMLRDSANSRRPIAAPTSDASIGSLSSATSATVAMPWAPNRSAVLGPTPHNRLTGNGCRNASSRSGGTSSSPSGLASRLATLARNFVRAMPTVMGSPTRARTSARSRSAMATGVPRSRRRPPTSRNASSTESGSTIGVQSRNTSNTSALARV